MSSVSSEVSVSEGLPEGTPESLGVILRTCGSALWRLFRYGRKFFLGLSALGVLGAVMPYLDLLTTSARLAALGWIWALWFLGYLCVGIGVGYELTLLTLEGLIGLGTIAAGIPSVVGDISPGSPMFNCFYVLVLLLLTIASFVGCMTAISCIWEALTDRCGRWKAVRTLARIFSATTARDRMFHPSIVQLAETRFCKTGGEDLRVAMHNLSKIDLQGDTEVYFPCHACWAYAAVASSEAVVCQLASALTAHSTSVFPTHVCPLQTGGDAPPVLSAKIMLLVEETLRRKAGVPEGEGTGKQRVDRKHYMRGGKKIEGKFKGMSDEDYSRILEQVEDGIFEGLLEEWTDRWQARDDRGSLDIGDDKGWQLMDRIISERQRRLVDDFAERAGINSRAFYEARNRMDRNPEGPSQPAPLWAYGEHWKERLTPEKLNRHVDACAAAKQVHDKTVVDFNVKAQIDALAAAATPAPVCEATSSSQLEPLVRTGSGAQTAREKAKKRNKGKKGPKLPESSVPNSTPHSVDHIVAAMEFAGGRMMQGYLFKGAANAPWFVTGRHLIVDGKVTDGFADVRYPFVTTLHRPCGDVQVTVVEGRSEGDDRLLLRLNGILKDVTAARVHPPQVGGVVHGMFFKSGVWKHAIGTVVHLHDKYVAYNMSTEPGCCRMAVFDAVGRIVAGHYYPGVVTPAGTFPAGEPEKGVIPSKWIAEYNPPPVVAQGDEQGNYLGKRGPFLRVEKHKVYGLRPDADLSLYKPEFYMAKPSTDMLKAELTKFWDNTPLSYDRTALVTAMQAVLMLENDACVKYQEPTFQDFMAVVVAMDSERTNAGSEAVGENHHEYLVNLGEGDIDRGMNIAAETAQRLYKVMCGDITPDAEDEEMLFLMSVFCVQGKRDGYKAKKLYVGRSIQAPCFTFKAIWKTVCGRSDEQWTSRDFMFRTGANMDLPLMADRVDLFRRTTASLGLDESAFDRRMPKEFMDAFFNCYLGYTIVGIPPGFCTFYGECTINSKLLMTDGSMYSKAQGNPSGFPATLRLNCVVQLLAWCYAYVMRAREMGVEPSAGEIYEFFGPECKHCFLEICGDDSRANCLSSEAEELLDARNEFAAWLSVWERHLPWEVKIEGQVAFPMVDRKFQEQSLGARLAQFPPLVARNLVLLEGYVWTPLYNTDRCIRKLMSVEGNKMFGVLGRTEADEYVLRQSAFMTLRLQYYWHTNHLIFSPTIQCLLDNGWLDDATKRFVDSNILETFRYAWFACQQIKDDH